MAGLTERILLIESYIQPLDASGLSEGDAERSKTEATATLKTDGNTHYLSYEEDSEGGKIFSDISASVQEVIVSRRGAIVSAMKFKEGLTHSSLYTLPPYSFDMKIRTKRIKNYLTESGGTLELVYDMELGGTSRACRMKITVKDA